MTYSPRLLDYIESLPVITWSGRVFRYTHRRTPPQKPNTYGARWNPPDIAALYTSLSIEGTVAEAAFHMSALTPSPSIRDFLLHTIDIDVEKLVDLRSQVVRAAIGLTDDALTADDHAKCRELAGACYWLDRGALLVPCARSPAATNLVIFTGKQSPGFEIDVVNSESLKI
jgi:RES domain-containing protein